MTHRYDMDLMAAGRAARRLICRGEDPWTVLALVVCGIVPRPVAAPVVAPPLVTCPVCNGRGCRPCGRTGRVTVDRHRALLRVVAR